MDESVFPSTMREALAMLYLQKQDLNGKSPEEIQTMYFEVCESLRKDYVEKRKAGWFTGLRESD